MPSRSQRDPVKIFVVDDDDLYVRFISYVLSLNPDYEFEVFRSGEECVKNIRRQPAVVTLDYSLPDMSGEQVLREIKSISPHTHVIIISGQEDVKTAVGLLKLGAFDYITKDEDTKNRLLNSVNNAIRQVTLIKEVDQLKQEITSRYEFSKTIIGASPALKQTFVMLEKAVKTHITVSITGETGTGKELIAKAIHYNSDRKNKSFVAVNIAAIPKDLIESELFGHEKGAFTGAMSKRVGKFEEANGGTIFWTKSGKWTPAFKPSCSACFRSER